MALRRQRLIVTGGVQGVGFRPFVYRLAHEAGLTGLVNNTPEGVVVEIQGAAEAVAGFSRDLHEKLPPLARIVSCEAVELDPVEGEDAFAIVKSSAGRGHSVLISPDTATCRECLSEMADPDNRRHLYPFTNCTNCGPRYTITRSIPYDRPYTSMACFPMCPACRAEYDDPLDRRFHAQPNACEVCGPKVWLTDAAGQTQVRGDAALTEAAAGLARGEVFAIKGLGGFHLAVDARNQAAVQTLRERKKRFGKPLAVMTADLASARTLAVLSETEAAWLSKALRPIVVAEKRTPFPLAEAIAPDTDHVGVMLPYTPLHFVLFHHLREQGLENAALVMTSGNESSEPICLGNREALRRLAHIADRYVLHDRDILIRTDDSVLRVDPRTGQAHMLRRARGFTPTPIFLAEPGESVLALGPELKNTVTVTKNDQAFVSQHIGDMQNLATFEFQREIAAHLVDILQVEPKLLVHDLHPDYMTTRAAREQDKLPTAALQHHFAHLFAIAAEHRLTGEVFGLALDGTGYGEDNTIWGGECLLVDERELFMRRLGRLAHLPLPGGEAAIRGVWRIAHGALRTLGIDPRGHDWPWLREHGEAARVVEQMLARNLNCPPTSSCGRLFDAAAALCGVCLEIDYEAQAAIRLEDAQDKRESAAYPCPLDTDGEIAVLDTLALLRALAEDAMAKTPAGVMARRFHLGLVSGLAEMAEHFARDLGHDRIALSGGVMHNMTLAVELPAELERRGFEVLLHREVPPGDGCISLGQAAYGVRLLALGRTG